MRSIMKYPGSKWSLAKWIMDQFPPHHSYLEPFFGSGAVFFNKPRSNIETVNDRDDNVVNLFEQIKNDPERFAREIYFTPYARSICNRAVAETVPEDAFQKAVRFFAKLNLGHGYRTNERRAGFKIDIQGRERAYAAGHWCKLPERIMEAAERLRGVQIENRDALELIGKFNSEKVLIYADPPYVMDTRHGAQYRHEMSDHDHEKLLKALINHRGSVVISGYDCDLYNDLLTGWNKKTHKARNQAGGAATEVIWYNYDFGQERLML